MGLVHPPGDVLPELGIERLQMGGHPPRIVGGGRPPPPQEGDGDEQQPGGKEYDCSGHDGGG